ncbi:M56 family metallopeptidase [Bacillus sp. USDA818B3_A]|uniref:M56 family metallopeptidase n=1 Tax=Bacillus sp. USDA818B3_A TaxID=2698834 RepID=UPI00136E0D5C|nr:M56 family metallopeptidase [Bacillus sp. USDA818B3_A]
MDMKQKSTAFLGLAFLIAIILFAQMAMYLLNIFLGPIDLFNVFNFCVSLFEKGTFAYYTVLALINSYILYSAFLICKRVFDQFVLSSSFRSKIHAMMNKEKSIELNQTFCRKKDDIVVIESEELLAFTFGFWKPIMVFSTALMQMLDSGELEAVIYHETSHQKYFHGLKVFILQIISEVLWYIPLTKWSYQNYRILVELIADEFAIHRMGSEIGLGSALLKLIKRKLNPHTNLTPAVVYFADGTVDYRLKQLINPQQTIPVKAEMESIIISLNVLMFILLLLVIA